MHGEHGFGLIAASLQRGHAFMKGFGERMLGSAERELAGLYSMGPGFDQLCRTAKESAEAYTEASSKRGTAFEKMKASSRRVVAAGERNNIEKAASMGFEL